LITIVPQRANRFETVIAAESRGAIALDGIEKQPVLCFLGLGCELVPPFPLSAGYEGSGFDQQSHR
jgi:hypothetical protein